MPKSKYPDKLDTSVEIPVVRDNITEIGSDVLNSLRSAIFNIEKTLGINPQGAAGNTVSSRLNNAIDANGNITKDALDRSGILSGPISNADVSKVAAISEDKLNLNFPTQLLQDQISILDNRIALFIKSLEELNALLSAHVHPDAINRHYATSIRVRSAEVEESSVAARSLQEDTLQGALEELYNSHINYTGEGVSSENNSHSAGQLYYDNQVTIDLISSNSVQGAIDEIAAVQGKSIRDSIMNLHSNGLIRTGATYDEIEDNECGSILVPSTEVSWSGPEGKSREIISFFGQPIPAGEIRPFDTLTILDSSNAIDNKDYIIESVNTLPSGALQSVVVFGGPRFPMDLGINARISRSVYTTYNENGLNCSPRPRYQRSNFPDIQAANPNAATIISSGIRAANIKSGESDVLAIEVDGKLHEINIFDPDHDIQSISTAVNIFNQYSVDNKLNAFAYKVRALKCYEIAITHLLPNFNEDITNRTLKIVNASANDAHQALGLGYILGREVEGLSGNVCHINGKLFSSFGNIKKYTNISLALNVGTTNLEALGINFLNEGIRDGDLCTIQGSTDEDDDGTYRIKSVEDDVIELDTVGATFSGQIDDDAAVFIQRSSAPVGELEFLAADGLILIDVFMTDSGDINFKRRADIVGHMQDAGFYAVVRDMSLGFIVEDDKYELEVDVSGMARLRKDPGGNWGEPVFVASTGVYKIFSEDKFNYIVLDVLADNPPAAGDSIWIEGHPEVRSDVMHLSRIVYSTEFGFVLGSPSADPAIPVVVDKRTTGTVDDTIISENILERYIQGPRNELRGSGVIRDLDLKDIVDRGDGSTCYIDMNPGVGVINGVRIEYLGINNLIYDYTVSGENFYIAMDGKGCLLVSSEIDDGDGNLISPFFNQNVAHIAYVEIDSSWVTAPIVTDLRLFVDHLDYKVIADITVAIDPRFGHFTDIKKAVAYAKRFSLMFPDMGSPSITLKEGTHKVEETIVIDFDLKISGAGTQTIIERAGPLQEGHETVSAQSPVFMIGEGAPDNPDSSTIIRRGVTFSDFTYRLRSTTLTSGLGTTFLVAQEVGGLYAIVFGGVTNWQGGSEDAVFRFENIIFEGRKLDSHDNIKEWGEEAILIGCDVPSGTASKVYGNVIISNCYFNWLGFGSGPCMLSPFNEFRDIIISNNIAKNVYGDEGVVSGSNFGVCHINPADYQDTTGDGIAFARVTEVGNVSDDQ